MSSTSLGYSGGTQNDNLNGANDQEETLNMSPLKDIIHSQLSKSRASIIRSPRSTTSVPTEEQIEKEVYALTELGGALTKSVLEEEDQTESSIVKETTKEYVEFNDSNTIYQTEELQPKQENQNEKIGETLATDIQKEEPVTETQSEPPQEELGESPQNVNSQDEIKTIVNEKRDTVKIYMGNDPPPSSLTASISLKSLPPLKTSPELDAENERLLQRYLKLKKMPSPECRQQLVQYTQRQKVNALCKGDYEKAQKYQDIGQKLLQDLAHADGSERQKARVDAMKERLEDVKAQIEEVNLEYKRAVKDEQARHRKRLKELSAQQDAELDEFEAQWNDENYLRQFAKPSPALLQIKARERQMVISKMFDAAEELKRKAAEMEKTESEEAQKRAFAEMEKQQAKIDARHAAEVAVAEQHTAKNIAVLGRNLELRLSTLGVRQATLEKELENAKHSEATVQRMAQTPENVETVMTPRTAQRMAAFKTVSQAPKITVKPLGNIKRKRKRPGSTM